MMRRMLVLLLLSPVLAHAATASAAGGAVRISTSSGVVGGWLGTTTGMAWGFMPLLFVLALIVEAFGRPPTEPPNFAAVVWRLVVVMVLLATYSKLFPAFAGLLEGAAARVSPEDTWNKLTAATTQFLADKRQYQFQQMAAEASKGSALGVASELLTGQVDAFGGAMIDAVVSIILLVGQASFFVVGLFGQALKALLFVLGPLAIVASIPRPSNAGAQWLRVFISVALWPLISSLLVGLLSNYALGALAPKSSYDSAYKSIALAGILCLCAFAVPVIATALTGAAMGAIGQGFSSGMMVAGMATRMAGAGVSVAGGVAGVGAPTASAGAAAAGAAPAPARAVPGAAGGAGAIASAAPTGPSGPSAPSPDWAKHHAGNFGLDPAQEWARGGVSPAGDAAVAQDIVGGGGAAFPASAPAAAKPPPADWNQGAISPVAADDDVPTLRPLAVPGPAAPRPHLGAAIAPAAEVGAPGAVSPVGSNSPAAAHAADRPGVAPPRGARPAGAAPAARPQVPAARDPKNPKP